MAPLTTSSPHPQAHGRAGSCGGAAGVSEAAGGTGTGVTSLESVTALLTCGVSHGARTLSGTMACSAAQDRSQSGHCGGIGNAAMNAGSCLNPRRYFQRSAIGPRQAEEGLTATRCQL